MKFIFIILSIVFASFCVTKSSAQLSDNLYKALPDSLKPANRASFTENEETKLFHSVGKEITSIYGAELALILSSYEKKITASADQHTKVAGFSAIADYYITAGDYDKVFTYYQRVLKCAANNSAYSQEMGAAYVSLSSLYTVRHQIDSAINFLDTAMAIGNQKDSVFMCQVYNAYQIIYLRLNQNQYFLDYTKKYISMMPASRRWNADYTIEFVYTIYGYQGLYAETNQKKYLDSANKLIRQLMEAKKEEPQFWYATCYFLSGRTYFWNGDYKHALSFFDSSLLPKYIDHSLNDSYMALDAKHFRIITMAKLGYKGALETLDTMKIWERDFGMLKLKNSTLYEAAKEKGDWKKALQYYKSYVENTDSLGILENRSKIFIANRKYSVAEKEAIINNLEKEKLLQEKKDNKNRAIATLIVLALIIAILLLIWYYKQLQLKKEKEKQQLIENLSKVETKMNNEQALQQIRQATLIKEQREKISKSIHDEINSGLAALRFYISDLKASATETKTKEVLGKVEEEAEHLYLQAREFMNNLTAANKTTANYNVVGLLDNLANRFNDESLLHIINKIDKPGIEKYFTPKQHYEMYSIIKEAIANIIKHASASIATISITLNEAKYNFSIADNGKGFNRQQIKEGLGLKSLESRMVNELHGELKINSTSKGTILNGSFPAI